MPRLHDWLEQFGERAGEVLSQTFGPGFVVTIESAESTSAFALMEAHRANAAVLFRSATHDASLILILDPRTVDIVVGAMFSLEATPDEDDAPPRPRTELETRLVIEFVKGLGAALRSSGTALADAELAFERLETLEELDPFGAHDMATLAASFTMKTPAGPLGLILALPQALTAALSEGFERESGPAAVKQDPGWARQLEQGIAQARVALTAILDEFEMTLLDVSELKVGRLLPLTGDGEGRIRLDCAERAVFLCKLGEHNDRYTLEIENVVSRQADAVGVAALH
jgi:flagellar motor switch protein FliM